MDYCTLAQLKRKLKRRDETDPFNDTYLDEAITRASRIVDTFTNSFFYEKTLSILIDKYIMTEHTRVINKTIFINAPITETVAAIIIEDGKTLLQDTDYFIYNGAGVIQKEDSWTTARKNIDLTVSIGHTVTPTDIVSATLEIAQILTGLGVQVVQGEDGDIEGFISTKIPSIIKKTLTKYKFILTL